MGVPGVPVPSSGLQWYQICMWCTGIHVDKTPIQIIFLKKEIASVLKTFGFSKMLKGRWLSSWFRSTVWSVAVELKIQKGRQEHFSPMPEKIVRSSLSLVYCCVFRATNSAGQVPGVHFDALLTDFTKWPSGLELLIFPPLPNPCTGRHGYDASLTAFYKHCHHKAHKWVFIITFTVFLRLTARLPHH